ncbi:MAG: hypothetical protein IJU70_01485 [Lentisphaeria bacterium]|nr:hypothetical protein [Lentisphaeria bacterium]
MKYARAALLTLLILTAAGALFARNDLSDLRGLTLSNAKIPIYNRGGKPQMMIFVTRAERRGRVISGMTTVLDFIRPTASVDDIGDAWKLRAYPLNAPFREVFDFWLPRLKYSEAVVTTSRADIDQETHKASGSDRIFLRSPLLDLNGIGFEADFDRREIRVNSEIEVVLRTAGSDPRKLESLKNKKHSFITATGDALLIELMEKRIMLIGSVVVKEEQATITCDRLTILLSKDKEAAQQKKKRLIDTESEIAGLSRILADGSIVVSGAKGSTGKLYADHLVYDIHGGRITLSSDTPKNPLPIARLRTQIRSLLKKAPHETQGFVVVDDPRTRSYGRIVQIELRRSGTATLPAGELISGMTETDSRGGAESVKSIVYPQGIVLAGKQTAGKGDEPFLVCADQGEFLPDLNAIDLKKNVFAQDSGTVLTCDAARLNLKKGRNTGDLSAGAGLDSVLCRRNVKLLHRQSDARSATLSADKADFFPGRNRILFYERVRGEQERSRLTCSRIELVLADRKNPSSEKVPVNSAALREGAASGKTLDRAVATGNVVMTDPNATLRTGLLTLFFREARPGEKVRSGMLQSGGAVLTKITCDNGVRLDSTGSVSSSNLPQGVSAGKGRRTLVAMRSFTDMATNISTFSGKVNVFDELSSLRCETLKLYGVKASPVPAKAAVPQTNIDDDPFDMTSSENFAPSRIAISGDLELDRVECIDNVVITHKTQGQDVAAGGEHADYKVSTGRIVITGKPPRRPWVRSREHRQESDKLVYHLKEERFESRGNTETTLFETKGK